MSVAAGGEHSAQFEEETIAEVVLTAATVEGIDRSDEVGGEDSTHLLEEGTIVSLVL